MSYAAREDSWSRSWVWEAARRVSCENSNGRITPTRTRQNWWTRCCEHLRAVIWSTFKRYINLSFVPKKLNANMCMLCILVSICFLYSTLLFTCSFCSCFYWINPVCFATAIWYKCCFLFLFYRFQKCRSTIGPGQHLRWSFKPLGYSTLLLYCFSPHSFQLHGSRILTLFWLSGSLIAMVLMDKVGRKLLLLWSFIGMVCCTFLSKILIISANTILYCIKFDCFDVYRQ